MERRVLAYIASIIALALVTPSPAAAQCDEESPPLIYNFYMTGDPGHWVQVFGDVYNGNEDPCKLRVKVEVFIETFAKAMRTSASTWPRRLCGTLA